MVLNARWLGSEYDLQRRRHLQTVLFPSGVRFDGEGFGTPVTRLFFKDLEAESGQETQMVSPTGFEHGGGVVESPTSLGYFNKATAGRAHTGEGAGKIVPEILDILQTH